ncbi:hypothetical protein L1049_016729 [Liquidambar formosana]|uniref:Uncharacterized protein n=1 Tax=Liquidambar formosana TaxID=63359 RepID=A0AAP0X712_LIQFO
MSSATQRSSGTVNRKQSSRLQRRAPASIQVSPASDWKVVIPLLSPLATSPEDRPATVKSREEHHHHHQVTEVEKPVFKKWQHPAAPFHYESAPLMPSFMPV